MFNKKLLVLTFCFIAFFSLKAHSQTIELDSKQSLTFPGPGFFPFSAISNQKLKDIFPNNPNLDIEFSNFLGGPCAVAPAADFSEIGPQIVVRANGEVTVDFSMAGQNVGDFGLSFVPQAGNCIFDILAKTPVVSTSSSSSSGASVTTQTFNPNAISIISKPLTQSIINQITNELTNKKCVESKIGVKDFTNTSYPTLFNVLLPSPSTNREIRNLTTASEENAFTAFIEGGKTKEKARYIQKLTNNTDSTKIFLFGIFPTQIKNDLTITTPKTIVIEHSIISMSKPFKGSSKKGIFIAPAKNCISPLCSRIESNSFQAINGECNIQKLSKKKAILFKFNPSMFFDPIQNTTISTTKDTLNLQNSSQTISVDIIKDRGYLILQPVPAMSVLSITLGSVLGN